MCNQLTLCIAPAIFAMYIPMCAPHVRATVQPSAANMPQLWERPVDLDARDLYVGLPR